MLLPEKEAKYKTCPLLTTRDDKLRMCLYSGCMMWRYKDEASRAQGSEGYCGLAGKPVGAP